MSTDVWFNTENARSAGVKVVVVPGEWHYDDDGIEYLREGYSYQIVAGWQAICCPSGRSGARAKPEVLRALEALGIEYEVEV